MYFKVVRANVGYIITIFEGEKDGCPVRKVFPAETLGKVVEHLKETFEKEKNGD